jgi:arginine/ornithine transport system substrate-binding protein
MGARGVDVVRYSSQGEIWPDRLPGRLDGTLADAIPVGEGLIAKCSPKRGPGGDPLLAQRG